MTINTLGDFGSRASPARGVLRRLVARAIATREAPARRTVNSYLLGVDDATLATFGYERMAVEEAGRRLFPL